MKSYGNTLIAMIHFRLLLAILIFAGINAPSFAKSTVVADSATHAPLPNASIFDSKGIYLGASRNNGAISCACDGDYPITVRYIGYAEKNVYDAQADTVFMQENIAELQEVEVSAKERSVLHVLAYVRDYSTLSSYTDTVTMYREKMVDFMVPTEAKTKFKGWRSPRIINSRSYYRFTDQFGLDSVSDRCNHHFTWSDWIGLFPSAELPHKLTADNATADTVFGKRMPIEAWSRNNGRISIDVDVLADSAALKWVPSIAPFFRKDNTEFEQFRLRVNANAADGAEIGPLDITGFSFNIESRGRGHSMFKFNKWDQPFFVTTYAEVYIVDKEFISVKEAKKWAQRRFTADDIEILEPADAPELQASTLALIDRVGKIDADMARLASGPDYALMSRNVRRGHYGIGHRAFSLLKQLTGITYYKSHKHFKQNYNRFRDSQLEQNKKSQPN